MSHAMREGAAKLIDRPVPSFVIGVRHGGVLENISGAFSDVPAGPRFRSDECALVEPTDVPWTQRRVGSGVRYCERCEKFLRSLIQSALVEKHHLEEVESGAAPSKHTAHSLLKNAAPERVVAALDGYSARMARAHQQARRAKAALIEKEQSHTSNGSCEVSQKLFTTEFQSLQASADFDKCFPKDSVQRYIWDDQMKNNAKVASGSSNKSFRWVGSLAPVLVLDRHIGIETNPCSHHRTLSIATLLHPQVSPSPTEVGSASSHKRWREFVQRAPRGTEASNCPTPS